MDKLGFRIYILNTNFKWNEILKFIINNIVLNFSENKKGNFE